MNILITGGSSGIGLGLRTKLTEMGHDVKSWSRREGVDITFSFSIMDAIRKFKGWVPDYIIHNAGLYHYEEGELQYRKYWFEKLFMTNVIGPDMMMTHLWPHLHPDTNIAVMSSDDISPQFYDWLPWQAAYNCSKAALEALCWSWQAEHPEHSYYWMRPRLTDCGIWEPSRGPAKVTLEETVKECLSILCLMPTPLSKEKDAEQQVSPSGSSALEPLQPGTMPTSNPPDQHLI